MGILEKAVTGVEVTPRRIVIYGEHAVGKTTWAARFDKPIVLCIEDGANGVDCTKIKQEHLSDPNEVIAAVYEIAESDFKTVVVDSADWLENLFEDGMQKSGFDRSFGKGQVELCRRFGIFLKALDACTKAGKTVILIAHQEIGTASDIHGNTWDRIQPKLSKKVCALVLEWADEVLLAKREDFIRKQDGAFGAKSSVATTTGRRVLKTQSHPSYVACSRLDLPAEIDLNADVSIFQTGAKS